MEEVLKFGVWRVACGVRRVAFGEKGLILKNFQQGNNHSKLQTPYPTPYFLLSIFDFSLHTSHHNFALFEKTISGMDIANFATKRPPPRL